MTENPFKMVYSKLCNDHKNGVMSDREYVMNLIMNNVVFKDILLKNNKVIYNVYFSKKYNIPKLKLKNLEHFNMVLDRINVENEKYVISFFLQYCFVPSIFYENEEEIIEDRKYYNDIYDILIDRLKGNIYTSLYNLACYMPVNYVYFFVYQGYNDKELYSKVCKVMRKICYPFNNINNTINIRKSDKIRVAFMGNFITLNHSVNGDRFGIYYGLKKNEKFEVDIITYTGEDKQVTQFFEEHDNYITKYNSKKLAQNYKILLRGNYDIIIYTEIGMDPLFRYLAFERLAPIQINTWGHSETSGLDSIDYYISSKYFEDEEAQENYSEKLILTNSLCTYYYNKEVEFMTEEELYRIKLTNNLTLYNVYGCFQLFHKMHPEFLDYLKEITIKDEKAMILLLDYDELSDEYIKYVKNKVSNVIFVHKASYKIYSHYYELCDVILDAPNFGGCNTTIDSFLKNKIVITKKSKLLHSNFTKGFYKKMNIDEFICESKEEYIAKAIDIVYNKEKRLYYEMLINERKNLIFEEQESIDEWANILENLYNKYYDV